MSLIDFPKVRIKKHTKGFVVEIQKTNWWGRKKWVHIISVSGIEHMPWYYSTYEIALEEATKYFKWHILKNSNNE